MPLHRRAFLATAATAAIGTLAGCAHPNAVLTMSPEDDAGITARYVRTLPPDAPEYDTLARAVENGTTTTEGTAPQLDSRRPYLYDGAVYEVTATEEAELDGTRVSVEIDFAPTDTESGVPLAEFPDPDRDLLSGFFPPEEDRTDGPDMGGGAVYTPEEAESSRLVTEDIAAVRYEGSAYPITVETRPANRYRYRIEATRVAADTAAFGADLKEQYLFTLSGLSEAERDLVSTAIDDGYYDGSGSDAFESVARRFREHEAVDEDDSNYIVRYDGTVYWADLYAPFLE